MSDARTLLSHRLLLVTGKGGVGKTTFAAALATAAAERGDRPLLVELGHRASMRSVFDVAEVGFTPRDVGHGVHAMSIDLDLAVVDTMAALVSSRSIGRAIAQNRVLQRLFAAMPAVGEVATLQALHRRLHEKDGGAPRWSPIIVDLDATGHALMFLELRATVGGLMGKGPLRRLVDEMADLMADPAMARLCLVTLPEELPVTETLQLHAHLASARSVVFGPVIVNRVPALDLDERDRTRLSQMEHIDPSFDRQIAADIAFGLQHADAATDARAQLHRLSDALQEPIVQLPDLGGARLRPSQLVALAHRVIEVPS